VCMVNLKYVMRFFCLNNVALVTDECLKMPEVSVREFQNDTESGMAEYLQIRADKKRNFDFSFLYSLAIKCIYKNELGTYEYCALFCFKRLI
jgi:hypothetical protein